MIVPLSPVLGRSKPRVLTTVSGASAFLLPLSSMKTEIKITVRAYHVELLDERTGEKKLAAMVCAINGGATAFSHVNDSGFWLVSSLLEMDEKTTLKSWTMMETIIGFTGLACAIVISLFA